jgi:hypothetical protein
MPGDAHKRAMRKWRLARSPHADVLTALERAVAAHPSGTGVTRRTEFKVVTRIERKAPSTSTSNGTDAA